MIIFEQDFVIFNIENFLDFIESDQRMSFERAKVQRIFCLTIDKEFVVLVFKGKGHAELFLLDDVIVIVFHPGE